MPQLVKNIAYGMGSILFIGPQQKQKSWSVKSYQVKTDDEAISDAFSCIGDSMRSVMKDIDNEQQEQRKK